MYQPSGNYDVLLGLGIPSSVSEALDQFLQEGFVEELSASIIESFTKLNEGDAMKCVQMMRDQCKDNNLSPEALNDLVVQFVPTEEVAVAEVEPPQAENEDVTVAEIEPETAPVETNSAESAPQSSSAAVKWEFGVFNARKLEPDAAKLKEILDRTGYPHEVTPNGLRRYGGPPPGMPEEKPGNGTEVFVGKVPQDIYEDTLIPMFESIGKLWELRVLTNKAGQNRGFGFVTYCDKKDAKKACETFDGMEVRPKKKIVVKLSVQFTRLHVMGVPKDKSKQEIRDVLTKLVENVSDVSAPISERATEKNRGFCFLDFNTYFEAAAVRNKWLRKPLIVSEWNNTALNMDWAIPNDNPDEEAAEKSTAIMVNGISKKTFPGITDAVLKELFSKYGEVSSVRRKETNAKINFFDHEHAIAAIAGENGKELQGANLEIALFIPLSEYAVRMRAMQQKPGYRKRFGGAGRRSAAATVDARTLLNKRMGSAAKPNFDVRSQLSSINMRRLGAIAPPNMRSFTVYNDHMGHHEDVMFDDPYGTPYEDPRSFLPPAPRTLKREIGGIGHFARPVPGALPPVRQMPLRSAPLAPRSVLSSLYPEREFPAYAPPAHPTARSHVVDNYYDDAPIPKVRRMAPPPPQSLRTVDPYARVHPGIKAVAPASGITRQALNAGGAASGGFSTTNSLPLGGRPMRLGPANPPPPIVRRYTPVPLRSFPEEGGAVRMPMRGFAGAAGALNQRGGARRTMSQIAPPMQSAYSHTGASFTKF